MSSASVHPTADLRPADWIVAAATEFGGRVDQLLPTDHPAYGRLFHRPDQGLPDAGSAWTWSEVAARHGTVLHPEAQWVSLTGGQLDSPHHAGPESPSDQPLIGSLDRLTLSRLVPHLSRHTRTPEECHVAVWDGFGSSPRSWGRYPTFRTSGRSYWLFPAVPIDAVVAHAVEFAVAGAEEEIRKTGRLAGLTGLRRGGRTRDGVDFVRQMREVGHVQSPSLWWPDDRAWVVHSEIDYDSTLIAGSEELVDDLLRDPGLECLRVQPSTSLEANADRINGP